MAITPVGVDVASLSKIGDAFWKRHAVLKAVVLHPDSNARGVAKEQSFVTERRSQSASLTLGKKRGMGLVRCCVETIFGRWWESITIWRC